MCKTIYAVIDYKDLTNKNETPRVLIVTTDFDEAKKCFDSEYKQSYNPSSIHCGDIDTELCFFRGERLHFFVALEKVGWIDDDGTQHIVAGFENIIKSNQ